MTAKETERRREWRARLAEQESSGLSIRGFCEERGIKENTFTHWVRWFRKQAENTGNDTATDGVTQGCSNFIELRPLERTNATYKIRTPSGTELELSGAFNLERVVQLLTLLGVESHA